MTTQTSSGMSPLPVAIGVPGQKSVGGSLLSNLREYGLLLALLILMVFFQWATAGTLFKPVNLTNIVLQNSYIIVMALGMLLVIVAGHIDLSVGSVSGLHRRARGDADGRLEVPAGAGVPRQSVRRWCDLPCRRAASSVRHRATGSPITSIPCFIVTLAGMLIFRGLSAMRCSAAHRWPVPVRSSC